MSVPQVNNNGGSTHDTMPKRRVSDNFSSSRSHAPEHHPQAAYVAQHRICEQLRDDAKRERTKVSIACKDLVHYVTDHQSKDTLVVGFPTSKDNPFHDVKSCSLV